MSKPEANFSFKPQRRNFMHALSATGLSLAGSTATTVASALAPAAAAPWKQAQAIIDRFARPPTFRKEDFLITAYGAQTCLLTTVNAWLSYEGQGMLATPVINAFDCYQAIADAIAACSKAGGGRVASR